MKNVSLVKVFLAVSLVMTALACTNCSSGGGGDDDSTDDNRATITITYTGVETISSGNYSIWCEIYPTIPGMQNQDGTYSSLSSSFYNPMVLDINPRSGDYYIAVFIEKGVDNKISTGGNEPYEIYSNLSKVGIAAATAVHFTENAEIDISFDDANTDW